MSEDSSSSSESSESSFEEDFPQQMFTSFDGEELQIQPYLFEPELQIETSEDSEDSAEEVEENETDVGRLQSSSWYVYVCFCLFS